MFESPDGYIIGQINPEEGEEIVKTALSCYRKGEPLCDYIGISDEGLEELLKPLIEEWVKCDVSVAAKCLKTNSVVGLLLGQPTTQDDPLIWGKFQSSNKKAEYYASVCAVLEMGVNVPKMFDVDCVLDHCFLAVHEDHRGVGIGFALALAMEEIGRNNGMKASTVTATNKFTAQIYKKLGFEVLFKYSYDNLEMNGKKLLDLSVSNGTTAAQVLGKKVD